MQNSAPPSFTRTELVCAGASCVGAGRASCAPATTSVFIEKGVGGQPAPCVSDAALSQETRIAADERASGEVLAWRAVSAQREPEPLFHGFFLGGFECSCQRLESGRRLDLLSTTRHDEFAAQDYERLRSIGMTACRDGVSWIGAVQSGSGFDFSHVSRRVRAARERKVDVIWDLMHFGWPDEIDVFSADFVRRFGHYARAFARWFSSESDRRLMVAPINEISFITWAGGDMGCMNPFKVARGDEMKVQLVRATIEAIEAIRDVVPAARFLQPEPVIHIVPAPEHPKTWRRVECDNLLQFETWDMLCGRTWQSLGGHPHYLDIVGVNFYSDNQFMLDGTTISRGDPRYRPFSEMLVEVSQRYQRPMLIAETGHEGDARAAWLRYVCDESVAAMQRGCELHGITLYPVVDTLGWLDDRDCLNGLWGHANDAGERNVHGPLAQEMWRQTHRLAAARADVLAAPPASATLR